MGRQLSLLAFAVLTAWAMSTRPAMAGCGCDHPPPAWSSIMPPFASPKKVVTVFAENGEFQPGEEYTVSFAGKERTVVAESASQLRVEVHSGAKPGPTEVSVSGPGYKHSFAKDLFTVLPPAVRIQERSASIHATDVEVAFSADGTLLIPIDLSRVQESMQLAFQFEDLALDFGEGDVTFYNTDGVDLTLFALAVESSTERQWGSYYGWEIEEDTGLTGTFYEPKVAKASKKSTESDVLTYWRHEFHTYAAAHSAGGTHEVGADGYHPDGSLHIDHQQLVIAISGVIVPATHAYALKHAEGKRDKALAKAKDADDRMKAEDKYQQGVQKVAARSTTPAGGSQKVSLRMLTVLAEHPIEPGDFVAEHLEELALEFVD